MRQPTDPITDTSSTPPPAASSPTLLVPKTPLPATEPFPMNSPLLSYYEAIEKASADMLDAARAGNWDHVIKLESACVLLISQLKNAARGDALSSEEAQLKSGIMKRVLVNDAEIRHLAEPWLDDLDQMLGGKPKTLH